MRYARPRARGRNRFRVGPSSTYASATKRVSAGSCWLCSALAIAESSTFLTGTAAARGVNWSTRRASSTWRPRMRSMTRRALNGETRTNRACALTPRFSWAWAFSDISLVPLSSLTTSAARAASANPGRPLLGAVDAEGPGRRELAELVADHRLGDVHGHVLAPIVDRDRVPDHVGDDRGAPRPGLDDPLVAPAVQLVDLLQQVVIHKRTLFQRSPHRLPSPPLAAAAQDQLVGGLAAAAGAALRLAPRAHRVAATRALALAAAERVVDRVHGHAARVRTLAAVAVAPRLAPVDQVVPGVADLADGGPAGHLDLADLTRGHPQRGATAFLGEQLDRDPGGAPQLGTAARAQLHGVHRGADRDAAQRQGVAGLDVRALAGLHQVPDVQAVRCQDVALLAVEVVEQGDAGGPVRGVLDRRDLGGHPVLVAAEVDYAVALLGATATVPRGGAAVHVPPAGLRGRRQQRLLGSRLRHLGEVVPRGAAAPGRRWLVIADTHDLPGALALALAVQGVHVGDADREDGLHGLLDLGLVRARVDDERVGVAVEQRVGLLAGEHVVGVELVEGDDLHGLEVAQAPDRRVLEPVDHEQEPAAGEVQRLDQLHGAARPGLGEVQPVEHHDVAAGEPVGERGPQRQDLLLLVDAQRVVARVRPEDHAAAGPLRGADGPLPGPPGALLAPGLLAAAAHLGPGLGRVRARPGGGELRAHHPVHDRHVDLHAEHLVGQVDGPGLPAAGAAHVDAGHQPRTPLTDPGATAPLLEPPDPLTDPGATAPLLEPPDPLTDPGATAPLLEPPDPLTDPGATAPLLEPPDPLAPFMAERIITRPPLGPGTAPRISTRLRSGSTLATSRLSTVTRSCPMWPAMRRPLKTRPGVAQAPTEPGERCLRSVPCEAPRPLKPCRFITPAKPLPLETPITSTRSPWTTTSPGLSSCPAEYSPASAVRSSTRWRRGSTPPLAKWPLSGLLTRRGFTSP